MPSSRFDANPILQLIPWINKTFAAAEHVQQRNNEEISEQTSHQRWNQNFKIVEILTEKYVELYYIISCGFCE